MPDIAAQAQQLAQRKHDGVHLPDGASTPMLEHITEVATLVESHGGTRNMIAAAWLHDIVEDTDVTLSDIAALFGTQVHSLVAGLTDPPHFAALPLKKRKRYQAARLRELGDDVKRIKLCDQLSNTRRVLSRPPLDWPEQKQWIYIQGAHGIAVECRGLWPLLDEQFATAYEQARKRFASGGTG